MTPKDKAKELFDKYKSVWTYTSIASQLSKRAAIECALLAINEILSLGSVPGEKSSLNVYRFYSEVKIELAKL
jgi:hypothetical protein